MNTEERHLEASEANIRQQQERAIAAIRGELASPGEDFCIDCDAPIPAARRAALPSAERCIGCQTKFEGRGSRGY